MSQAKPKTVRMVAEVAVDIELKVEFEVDERMLGNKHMLKEEAIAAFWEQMQFGAASGHETVSYIKRADATGDQ